MSNVNTVALGGNLTRDPELRYTPSGTAVCNLGIAVNRSRKTDDGWEDETSFFDITVWAGRGELCAKKLSKGSQVFVQGRLEQQRWEQDGANRSKVVVIAEQIEGPDFFQKGGRDLADAQASGGEQQQAATPAAAQDDDIPF